MTSLLSGGAESLEKFRRFVTAAESKNVTLAAATKGRIEILVTVPDSLMPRPRPVMRKRVW